MRARRAPASPAPLRATRPSGLPGTPEKDSIWPIVLMAGVLALGFALTAMMVFVLFSPSMG
jgi:hypothetical protein